jgi:hypothetical protein
MMSVELREQIEKGKKRYLNAKQCKATAARIADERRLVREGRKPLGFIHIWKGNPEELQAKIRHMYNHEEADLIISHLDEEGVLSVQVPR